MAVGSISWRKENYGLMPTLKYVMMDKLKSRNTPSSSEIPVVSAVSELLDWLAPHHSQLNYFFQDDKRQIERAFITQIDREVESGKSFKFKSQSDKLSTARLDVLHAVLLSKKMDLIIETGTQNAFSAWYICELLERLNIKEECKFYSFDVEQNDRMDVEDESTFVVLQSPTRDNFRKMSLQLVSKQEKVLFFHDSDHSYENMIFEFSWAWDQLKSEVLVSDDVHNNSAFMDFFRNRKAQTIFCELETGKVIGIAIRSQNN